MPNRVAILIAGLFVAFAQPAGAQAVPSIAATAPLRFESWQPAALNHGSTPAAGGVITVAPSKKNNWLIGGAVGFAAGFVFCTAVSTLMNDSASGGLSFCPLDSYLLIGGAGFLLGAAIGLAL
jgi:hypothetical protein